MSWFFRASQVCRHVVGHPFGFLGACAVVLLWALTGPVFGFSDTWQLVINTGTTIVTFLMMFLVANGQNQQDIYWTELLERTVATNAHEVELLDALQSHIDASKRLHERTVAMVEHIERQEAEELAVLKSRKRKS